MPLTDAKLRTLKPGAKPYKVSDGEGLHVVVSPGGSVLWRLAYRIAGRQKLLALGSYPTVPLIEAREARLKAKRMLRDGTDPGHERKVEKRRQRVAAGHTFGLVAEEWFRLRKSRWVPGYAERLRSRLELDLLPELGSRPIAEIEPIEVLDVVRKIEGRDAPEMARRVMQMASAIFRYGVATSRCMRDPTADLRGALAPPKPVKGRLALPASDLPDYLRRLAGYDGDTLTRLALELLILTFVRTSELRFAQWSEFEDLNGSAPLWRIPADRMKMRRAHLVPLSPQAAAVVGRLKALKFESSFLFPAHTRSGVISENTMLYALYRMGFHGRATVHGFRKTASTVLNEHQFNRDWVEMQLAHAEGSIRSIYNAAEWLQGRRDMMVWWGDYLDERRESLA